MICTHIYLYVYIQLSNLLHNYLLAGTVRLVNMNPYHYILTFYLQRHDEQSKFNKAPSKFLTTAALPSGHSQLINATLKCSLHQSSFIIINLHYSWFIIIHHRSSSFITPKFYPISHCYLPLLSLSTSRGVALRHHMGSPSALMPNAHLFNSHLTASRPWNSMSHALPRPG